MVDTSLYLVLGLIAGVATVFVALFRSQGFWEWLRRRELLREKRRIHRTVLSIRQTDIRLGREPPDSDAFLSRWEREVDRIFGVETLIPIKDEDQE